MVGVAFENNKMAVPRLKKDTLSDASSLNSLLVLVVLSLTRGRTFGGATPPFPGKAISGQSTEVGKAARPKPSAQRLLPVSHALRLS